MAEQVVKFYNGNTYPILGLGTWQIKTTEANETVKYAIDVGYRHIDCASIFGNEYEVGLGIAAKIKEGVIKREDIFVTGKLWNTHHQPNLVEFGLKKTLQLINLEYLDLYLMHSPMGFQPGDIAFPKRRDGSIIEDGIDYIDTYRAMEGLVEKGLVKNIGISNFNCQQVERLLSNCTIKPVTNQIECHPYLIEKELSDFCNSKGILITAYCPLCKPGFSANEPNLLEDPKIIAVATKYKKTPAQVVLRYQTQRGHLVIPKSVTESRIQENFNIFDFELSPEDMNTINGMNSNTRVYVIFELCTDTTIHHCLHNRMSNIRKIHLHCLPHPIALNQLVDIPLKDLAGHHYNYMVHRINHGYICLCNCICSLQLNVSKTLLDKFFHKDF
ncbi:1,5-anhydro-D-fructose reductase [Melipona quadrifasciata]|uniref:1,5-anhydro-D-fructose reductase n=1 Tax=Melipona quadrifasciata TaxID=166423 RepID=A0A0M9A9X0_9HYME|nr:1,5-anhydro-D-fructose reductase [Melipona quadrifasciata]